MSTTPQLNFVQNVFALNMFSNLASNKKGTAPQLQTELNTMLTAIFANADMQKLIGTWQILWGPVVGEYGIDEKGNVASNALFVAVNQDGQYVVATSGTNPVSKYGWFIEDFDVHTMVLWPGMADAPDAPRISNATNIGLNHLLSMVDNSGVSLLTFLKNTFTDCAQQTQLVVTGHSLGGALSSVLALYINQNSGTWNPPANVIVSALPSAGASPGNEAFSAYFNKTIGARTLRFWNKLDPVPHGWEPDMVEQVPFLYYPYFKPGFLLKGIAALALSQSLMGTAPYPDGGFYTQLQLQTPPLPGQVNINNTVPPSAAEVLQLFVDMEASSILKKLGVNSIVAGLIVDAINVVLKLYANEVSIDALLDKLRAELQKIAGHEAYLEKLLTLLGILLNQLENVGLFLYQLLYQHVTTYPQLMGTSVTHPLSQAIVNGLVSKGNLDDAYTDVWDKFFDPKLTLKAAAPKLGSFIESLLTDEFVAKNGLKIM